MPARIACRRRSGDGGTHTLPVRSSSFHLPPPAHLCEGDRDDPSASDPFVHGYSLREIATHLGSSVTTVHRRVHACGDGIRNLSVLAAGGTKKT